MADTQQIDTIDNAPWNKIPDVAGSNDNQKQSVLSIDSAPWNQKQNYEQSTYPILGKLLASTVSAITIGASARQAAIDSYNSGGEAGLGEQNRAEFQQSGIFNKPGEKSALKTAARGIIEPSAFIFDAANRPIQAAFEGLKAAVDTAGGSSNNPYSVSKGAGELLDYLAIGAPEVMHLAPSAFHVPPEHAEALAHYAQRVDEPTYMGLKPATLEAAAIAQASAESLHVPEPTTEAAYLPTSDINQAVRNMSPQLFSEYDSLNTRKEFYTNTFNELLEKKRAEAEANAPHNEEIISLKAKLDDANPRKAKIYQGQIDDLTEKNEAYVEEQMHPLNFSADIKNVREKLAKITQRLGDMAPDVRDAYRAAQEHLPEVETVEPEIKTTEPIKEVSSTAESSPLVADSEKGNHPGPWEKTPIEDNSYQAIADDVKKRLVTAGRPEEEATAAAALVAEHYKAIAEQGWAKGSPVDIYKQHGADIEQGRERAKTLAQNQGKELNQRARGNIKLATDEARATIRLFKSANASTFIHETGHQWLEEMLRFSKEEDAPEGLKNDVASVRKWLGVNEGEEIATRHHEKFARGFERYMMEGVAPSRQLAGVFAKFKEWLTRIYQTVERLKSPITDDIRSVFDRLLSSKPEKTIIAPDHEPGKMMADIHEADAKSTSPEHAEAIADNIRKEVDQTAKLHNPEVANEIKTAEAAGNTEAVTGNQPVGAATESATGEAGTSQEPGAINTSGIGPTPASGPWDSFRESAGARGGDIERVGKKSIGPNDKFGISKYNLVDKAGNIRLDLLNTTEDIDKVLKDTAGANNNFMAERRGVISNGMALDLADALGIDPSLLDTRKIGQAFNAEQIIKAVRLLVDSAQKVSDVAKAGDKAAYLEAVERHRMIQGHVSGITAEAGRALQIFQSLKKVEGYSETKALSDFLEKQENGKTLNQLEEEMMWASNLKDAKQVSKFIEDSKSNRFKKAIIEYYVNALISGPITHFRYSVGNAVNALWRPLVEIPIAAATGKDVYLKEIPAQLYAIGKGSRDGWRAAVDAFKSGVSESLPGEHGNAQFLGQTHAIPGTFGNVINLPSKSVAAIHSFFKALRYEQNIAGLSVRTALKEGLEYGSDEFNNRVADLSTRPTNEMMDEAGNLDPNKIEPAKFAIIEDAAADALKELYMAPQEYHSALAGLTRFTNNYMPAKIMMPFMKIGTQITRNAFIERTPLGLLSSEIRANLSGVNGGAARDMQIGKIVAGTALIGATVGAAAEGLMTGDGPEDPKERAVWMLNHRPNSIVVGNVSIPYQELGSLGMLMRFSANAYQSAHGWNAEDGHKFAISALEGLVKSVLDENFMRGAKDALDALYHPEEYGESYLKSFASNWLPFSVGLGQLNRSSFSPVQDKYQRQVNDISEAMINKVPGLSENLQPKRDVFGRKILNDSSYDDYKNDPVVQRLEALHIGIGRLERKINGVQLSEKQYDDYSRIAGVQTKLMLNALISPTFQYLPPGEQIQQINKTVGIAREIARGIVKSNPENQDIIQKMIKQKQDIFKPSQTP